MRDNTKYNVYIKKLFSKEIIGNNLPKSRMVSCIVADYAKNHSYEDVLETFGATRDTDATGRGYQNDCIISEGKYFEQPEHIQKYYREVVDKNQKKFYVNVSWGKPMPGDRDCLQAFIDAATNVGYTVEINI